MQSPTSPISAGEAAISEMGCRGGSAVAQTGNYEHLPCKQSPSSDTIDQFNEVSLSRKSSFGMRGQIPSPPVQKGHCIMKSKSVQLKYDVEDAGGINASSCRASTASLGGSLSFTGRFPSRVEDANPNASVLSADGDDDEDDHDDDARMEREAVKQKRTLVEPTLPISLTFTGLKYKVVTKSLRVKNEKEILHGIRGSARPGEVLALMGPSGSGKTTLLNLLGGRLTGRLVLGDINYNGQPYSKSLKRRMGFVTQDDVLFAHLTVKETLTYAALLRLPKTLTRKQKEKRAIDVIHELGLERCQDTIVGGSFVRGISGGERKRVSIGNEVIINPSILFLDEPTSGLDSTTALTMVQMLHSIAEAGKTVITTIHQPSSRMFYKFDKLILLGKGSLLFFGKASEVMAYFSSIGFSPILSMNPAEFLLDLANGNLTGISVPSELRNKAITATGKCGRHQKPSTEDVHKHLVEAFESQAYEREKGRIMFPINKNVMGNITLSERQWGASWWQQYNILFWRGLKERRHEYLSSMRITQVLATSVIIGFLWWHSDSSTPKGLQDQAGLLFFISVFWGFFPVIIAIFTFPQERAMLNKERAVDMYRLSSYFLARISSDMPLDLFPPIAFLSIVYFMTGLKLCLASFLLSMLILFLSILAAQGLGLAIGAMVMDVKKATTLASITVMTFMLSGGFFVKKVHSFISWVQYLSFTYHTYRLLLQVQYDHTPLYISDVDGESIAKDIIAMIAMAIGYRLLAYISLRRMPLKS